MAQNALRWATLLAGLALVPGCSGTRKAPPRPSLVFILLDTARADRWSCLGYPETITPNIDILASEGILFEDCITPGSWTLPSHATFFTGLYPRDHGADCEHLRLDDRLVTLAGILAGEGYETVGFSNNPWVAKGTGLAQGFGEFHDMWRRKEGAAPPRPRLDDGAAETNERVLRWLDERPDPGRPFFLFINYLEPHLPYARRPRTIAGSSPREPTPTWWLKCVHGSTRASWGTTCGWPAWRSARSNSGFSDPSTTGRSPISTPASGISCKRSTIGGSSTRPSWSSPPTTGSTWVAAA